MPFYNAIIIVICLTACFAYVTERFTRLPVVIGVMLFSLIGSLLLVLTGTYFPQAAAGAKTFTATIHFPRFLMQVMLGPLLFAGSIRMRAQELRQERLSIAVLATAGTVISTFLAGTLMYMVLPVFGLHLGYLCCMLFGAVVSPTDPIAVLSILRRAGIPRSLEVKISGESLFNDGVAVVIFTSLTEIIRHGIAALSAGDITLMFAREALGGIAYGWLLGYAGVRIIRSLNSYLVPVIVTFALVTGGYALAEWLHVSGPLAMVAAGIIMGNKGSGDAVPARSRAYLDQFWELIDEMLNVVLFLLIGLEILLIPLNGPLILLGSICIILLLLARWISVAVPVAALRMWLPVERGAVTTLTWGGLRGGLSLALALSVSNEMGRSIFVPVTYLVVVFSVLVQGLTIGAVARRAER